MRVGRLALCRDAALFVKRRALEVRFVVPERGKPPHRRKATGGCGVDLTSTSEASKRQVCTCGVASASPARRGGRQSDVIESVAVHAGHMQAYLALCARVQWKAGL